jgi:hypothetical protein
LPKLNLARGFDSVMVPLIDRADPYPRHRCRASLLFATAFVLFVLSLAALGRGAYWAPSGTVPSPAPEVPIGEQMLISLFYWGASILCMLAAKRCVFASLDAWGGYLPAAQ